MNKEINKNNEEKGFIRKTMLDENGKEYEVEKTIDLPNMQQEKYLEKISKLLDSPIANIKVNSKRIPDINSTYYYNPIRGGKSIIVSDDGSYLLTISSVIYYEKLLKEFNAGRRNGNFNVNNFFKIKCHSCGDEISIDVTNIPKNIKTLDTICPNCKSFIKYANPNYEETNLNELSIIEISAIKKSGIPTNRHENTVLLVSNDYAVVDNNRYNLSKANKQKIDNLIKKNYDILKRIEAEQTPEFLINHTAINDMTKIFALKLKNEELKINYQTGTASDNIIKKLIYDITSLIFNKTNNSSNLKEIIDGIFSKLTGNNQEDIAYLNKALEEYKTHPLSKEIIKEIGRKIYDLLPEEDQKQFEESYSKDIDNINKMLKEVKSYIFSQHKDLEKAKSMLLDFIKGSLTYDNDNATEYYNFNDVIEFVLYTRIKKAEKDIKWIDIPFVTAYSYLAYIYNEEGNFDEALKMIEQTIRWNPMSLSPLFEKCETYKIQKQWEKFKEITLSLYDKIYNANDLAHYYRNLGFYYIEMNNLDLAYALYTASIKFEKNNNAYGEMAYINKKLNRESYNMSAEEGLKLLKENNITFGPKQENLDRLLEIYLSEKELIKNPNVESMLANRIYQLSKDKRFVPFWELVDKTTGCSIVIPRSWSPVKEKTRKEKFGSHNMFAIYTNNNSFFQANYDGKCSKEQFEEAYKLNVDNIKNSNKVNAKLLDERTLTLKLPQGVKDFKQALFDIDLGDKIIRIIHNFTLINDIFVDFSINLDEKIDYLDKEKFNNQKNMNDIINLLSNIVELKSGTTKTPNSEKEDLLNKIDNKFKLTNEEFEEINTNFKNNKDISKVFDYATSIFKDVKDNDPFWIKSAKETLIYILTKLLETKNTLNYDDLKEIIDDKNKFMKMCKTAEISLDNNDIIKIVEHIKKSSDKMLDSYYSIIKENLKIVTPKNETITHNIKFNSDLNFNITISKDLGTLTHPNEASFRIGNNITIINAKCNNPELLKKRASEWMQNSANTNNQTILDDLEKEYTLKNKQINVIEKVVIKENKNRYYKFVYYDQTMLIFGYSNKELSGIIDKAIISLKSIKEQLKIERDPFANPA